MQFKHWSKIPIVQNEIWTVTEKIDGTNGLIAIDENNDIFVGSRTRWLTDVKNDNYGFLAWALENKEDLLKLGPGYHYGEWYGKGIQRGYDLKEKRFALFYLAKDAVKPECCDIVPDIYCARPNDLADCIQLAMRNLNTIGSLLVPGYMLPEGIIIRSTLTGQRYKYILENNDGF